MSLTANPQPGQEAVSFDDLPIGTGAKKVPEASEVHPANTFDSGPVVGTGALQNIAHGLGRVPNQVWAIPLVTAAGVSIVEGAHDATNIKVTVTNGDTFKVVAI